MQEIERGDSGLRSFVSVQGALVMYPIYTYGSAEQKGRWLPKMQWAKSSDALDSPSRVRIESRRHAAAPSRTAIIGF